MNPGDFAEIGCWVRGEHDHAKAKSMMLHALVQSAAEQGVELAEPEFTRMEIMDDRVPNVPDGFTGDDVHFLAGQAMVVRMVPITRPTSFAADLEFKDLQRLRKITRQAHLKNYGNAHPLTDEECDKIIDAAGPKVMEGVLREAVSGTRH